MTEEDQQELFAIGEQVGQDMRALAQRIAAQYSDDEVEYFWEGFQDGVT